MAKTATTNGSTKSTKKRTRKARAKKAEPVEQAEGEAPKEEEAADEQEPEKQETAQSAETEGAQAEVTDKEDEESIHEKYERIKKGDLHLKDLQNLDAAELHKVAKKEDVQDYMGLSKQELVFKILKERIRQNGLMYGEGVLEVLPDGYGFLRSPKYSYLSSADDVYVSPSQIRRFGLRSGNTDRKSVV